MRLFQNSGVYRSYRPRLAALTASCRTFAEAQRAFLDDRFGAAHFLKPVLDGDGDAFFANGDDDYTQRLWARENGLAQNTALEDILLAQIEAHRSEVFYNMDPMRYGDAFLARLPGSVKRTIAWRAAPSGGGQFYAHDLVVNNFPSIRRAMEQEGARTAPFYPAHDPVADTYAANEDRPIDLLFVGTYSRHHARRAAMLDVIAGLRREATVAFHLDRSRFTTLAETPLGWVGPLKKHRRSRDVRAVANGPVFGRDLLGVLSQSKVIFNGAIDMSGSERGNMRVWEALGCRALMVSDAGDYNEPLAPGDDFVTYSSPEEARSRIRAALADPERRLEIAQSGHQRLREAFSKERQWSDFQSLAS